MVRKVVGRISRELNRDVNRESVDIRGSKTASGAVIRRNSRVSAPPSAGGPGPYYWDDDDI